jgi:alkylhydroperoxidase family enzyme
LQGGDDEVAAALGRGDLSAAPVNDQERALLQWVELLTRASYRNTADDVQRLRDTGWNDAQIAEAAYITALFAFFNRVADAFGLEKWVS